MIPTTIMNHRFSPRAQDEVHKCHWCSEPRDAHIGQPQSPDDENYWPIKHLAHLGYLERIPNPEQQLPQEITTPVNNIQAPIHYVNLSPEPLDVIEAWGLSFHEGNIIKYVARWRNKGGIEDLKKAREYLDRLIAMQERK